MALHLPTRAPIAEKGGILHREWERALKAFAAGYGTWVPVDYDAANFGGSGAMTWAVDPAGQVTFEYTLAGKRLEVAFVIRVATVGGVVDTTLTIAIPGLDARGNPFVSARDMTEAAVFYDDNGTKGIGVARVYEGGRLIEIKKATGANWTAGTNWVEGRIVLEVR